MADTAENGAAAERPAEAAAYRETPELLAGSNTVSPKNQDIFFPADGKKYSVPGSVKHVVIQQDDTETKPKKKKVVKLTAEQKALKNKENEINSTTRWLADSSFTTYFGKPAFHAYGKGNVKPANPAYKMLTHNINGCTGKQSAQFQ